MCGEHHEHREHHGRRSHGFRGRRGYPSREQWLERLQAYRQHLDEEQKNVEELIERLGEAPQQTASV